MFDELNARQSEILREIPQKASPKPRKSVRCSLRNVKRFQMIQISDCRAFSPFETVPGSRGTEFILSPGSDISSTKKPKWFLESLDISKRTCNTLKLACSRRSDSGTRAKKKASERVGKNEGRLGKRTSPLELLSSRLYELSSGSG